MYLRQSCLLYQRQRFPLYLQQSKEGVIMETVKIPKGEQVYRGMLANNATQAMAMAEFSMTQTGISLALKRHCTKHGLTKIDNRKKELTK